MESHKHYTQSETEFLLSCAETDENELLDYEEFVERFHEPAKVNVWCLHIFEKVSKGLELSKCKPFRMINLLLKSIFRELF